MANATVLDHVGNARNDDREAFEQAAAAYHGLTVESMRDARLSNGSYRQPTLARDWAFFQLGAAHAVAVKYRIYTTFVGEKFYLTGRAHDEVGLSNETDAIRVYVSKAEAESELSELNAFDLQWGKPPRYFLERF